MNSERLNDAFRDAASDAPEAGFSVDDVRRESHRIGRRNRMLLTGGIAAAVIVLAGGVTTGVVLTRDPGAVTSAAAPVDSGQRSNGQGSNGQGSSGPGSSGQGARELGAPNAAGEAPLAPSPGGAAESRPGTGPLGPADGQDCVNPQDPALRSLVDSVVPELASAREAPTTMVCRPGGGREVNLEVTDGSLTGLFSVVYTPPGEAPAQTGAASNWAMSAVTTASGGQVTVTSRADADSGGTPFGRRVESIAEALAPLL